jgi:glycosyltransferase involved in cell wall biosynthesis
MNQIYVVLGGVLWRFWHKKIALWYTHKQVGVLLNLAEKLVDKIFTASAQSFNLKSNKVVITGHGIDTDKFYCLNREIKIDNYRILTVGRITRIKNLATLIQATGLLVGKIENLHVDIVGSPITEEDKKYQEELLVLVKKKNLAGVVGFLGPRPYTAMPEVYCAYNCLVNLAPTGGVDKAVLEAMSCGLPAVVANRSFEPIFGAQQDLFLFEFGQPKDLVRKISALRNFSVEEYKRLGHNLREQVIVGHDLKKTIPRIISEICQK